jgi:hypothetical protein
MATEHQLEVLNDALSAYYSAVRQVRQAVTLESVKAEMRAINELMDAVADIDGYAVAVSFASYGDLAEHAAAHVTRWLCSAA